ncbi:MAG: hypothetical protein LBI33_13850 [Propionibacteriaceae bacterium]|jgi:hypothetical protein|nr:hypothetical protein [Propionibacteriaceae bacterium]
MSALEAGVLPAAPRTSLNPVAAPDRSPVFRGVFPLVILALLAVAMVGHLVLQTKIQEQAFELGSLQSQTERLAASQAILTATLDKKTTPQQLAYEAAQLGMVADPYATYLVLPTGQVTGTNQAVRGNEVPVISAAPVIGPPADPVPPAEAPVAEAPVAEAPVAEVPPADPQPEAAPVEAQP